MAVYRWVKIQDHQVNPTYIRPQAEDRNSESVGIISHLRSICVTPCICSIVFLSFVYAFPGSRFLGCQDVPGGFRLQRVCVQ